MTDSSQPPQPPRTFARLWVKIMAAFGIFSAFDIVSHAGRLLSLSASLHWIVGWWRFAVGSLFWWLHLRISPLAQDAIVLLGLILGAANVWLMSQHRITIFALFQLRPTLWDIERLNRILDKVKTLDKAQRWGLPAMLLTLALIVFLLAIIGWEIPVVGVILLVVLGLYVLGQFWERESQRNIGCALIGVVILPVIAVPVAFVMFILSLGAFARPIARSAGIVLLLLALNLFFEKVIDPIAPLLASLPPPPPPPS